MRTLVSATVALVLCAGNCLAEDYKGKVTKVESNSITVSVDGKDMTFSVNDKTTFSHSNKKASAKVEAEKLNWKGFSNLSKRARRSLLPRQTARQPRPSRSVAARRRRRMTPDPGTA